MALGAIVDLKTGEKCNPSKSLRDGDKVKEMQTYLNVNGTGWHRTEDEKISPSSGQPIKVEKRTTLAMIAAVEELLVVNGIRMRNDKIAAHFAIQF